MHYAPHKIIGAGICKLVVIEALFYSESVIGSLFPGIVEVLCRCAESK
jgi:hypothetical protein